MAFPPDSLCIEFPEFPEIDDVCLPGGICLSYVWDAIGKIPTAADMNMDFFSQIGPAMAPLKPFFDMLDTVLAIFNCVKAVPDAILKLDPGKIFECIPALAELIDKLLDLIPQLSLPKLLIALLKNLATLLDGIADDLEYFQSQIERIADLIDKAADLGNLKMDGFLTCAQSNLDKTAFSTSEALEGIGKLLILMNILMGLFGGPEVPCFSSIIGDNIADGLDVVIDILRALADFLRELANSIPDPDYLLTLALGEQKC